MSRSLLLSLFTFSVYVQYASSCPYARLGRHLQNDNIHALFDNRQFIHREVETTMVGVMAVTTSPDERVAGIIQAHVQDMMNLDGPIRTGDPLFAAFFEHFDQTHMNVTFTTDGVQVTHTATTDCGVLLIQAHANQISRFVETGNRMPDFAWEEPSVCRNPSVIVGVSDPVEPSDESDSVEPSVKGDPEEPTGTDESDPVEPSDGVDGSDIGNAESEAGATGVDAENEITDSGTTAVTDLTVDSQSERPTTFGAASAAKSVSQFGHLLLLGLAMVV